MKKILFKDITTAEQLLTRVTYNNLFDCDQLVCGNKYNFISKFLSKNKIHESDKLVRVYYSAASGGQSNIQRYISSEKARIEAEQKMLSQFIPKIKNFNGVNKI